MKGRKPKPTRLKILQGNPGGRPLNDAEPEPNIPDEFPMAPDYLNDAAKEEWNRIGPELYGIGLLTSLDIPAFELYCNAYARYINAFNEVEKHGMIVHAPSGYPVQNPYLSIINKAYDQMKIYLAEFGMTPASRTRVKTAREKQTEKKKGFA